MIAVGALVLAVPTFIWGPEAGFIISILIFMLMEAK